MRTKNIRLIGKDRTRLIFKNKALKCQIGENGKVPFYKKKEGDLSTPRGLWNLGKVFFRQDRIKYLKTNKTLRNKISKISENCVWSDDINNFNYNKYVKTNSIKRKLFFNHERLYREDNAYDIFIVINFNIKPIIRGKGSAIFLHCSFNDLRSTKGCIAINKKDFLYLCRNLNSKSKIQI